MRSLTKETVEHEPESLAIARPRSQAAPDQARACRLPVIAVGSAASSGSTLLADLLDAVPTLACGPELNILCLDAAYRYDAQFKAATRAGHSFPIRSSLLSRSRFFNTRHLDAVGLDAAQLDRLITEAQSLNEFVAAYTTHYAEFRARPLTAFAEKTPQNIAYAADFHAAFPDGLFVIVVRDGRSVVGSLRRRGYVLYEAALIWLWETHVGRRAATSLPRVVEIRYEDLVTDPFSRVVELVASVGIDASPSVVQENHRINEYRSQLHRVDTWRASLCSREVIANLGYEADLSDAEVAFLETLVLRLPDGTLVSFAETLAHYGYPFAARGRPADLRALEYHAAEYFARSRNLVIQAKHALLMTPAASASALRRMSPWGAPTSVRRQRRLLARLRRTASRTNPQHPGS